MRIKYLLAVIISVLILSCNKPSNNPDPGPSSNSGYFKVDSVQITLSGKAQAADSFYIESDRNWKIVNNTPASWLHISSSTGANNQKIILSTLEANKTGALRTTSLKVIPSDTASFKPVTVLVTQLPDSVPPPFYISGLFPDHGPANLQDTIKGKGFSQDATQNAVLYNGKQATVISANDSVLIVSVPVEAGTGNVSVTVNSQLIPGPVFHYELSEVATVFAGTGYPGSQDGIGTQASFATPTGLAMDNEGNLYVAEVGNNIIRKVTPDAVVSKLAGQVNKQGSTDGPASTALFQYVYGVGVDTAGNVYVADAWGSSIRKIDKSNQVSTIASHIALPIGVTGSTDGNIYFVGPQNTAIGQISVSGTNMAWAPADRSNSPFGELWGISRDRSGNFFVTDVERQTISKIDPSGNIILIAGIPNSKGFTDGNVNTATFNHPCSAVPDSKGNLYIADQGNNAIRKISTDGKVTTIMRNVSKYAVDGGGFFKGPFALVVDRDDHLYIANTGENTILKTEYK